MSAGYSKLTVSLRWVANSPFKPGTHTLVVAPKANTTAEIE
jgi:hypothetical protein